MAIFMASGFANPLHSLPPECLRRALLVAVRRPRDPLGHANTAVRAAAMESAPRGMDRTAHLADSSGMGARRLVDLSHDIHHGMVTYPGLPGPEVSDYLT